MMCVSQDEQFARRLQNELNAFQSFQFQSPSKQKENTNPVDSKLELIDPTPSIHDLFVKFDNKFFWGTLGMVQVTWSNRMTKCAGMCSFEGKRGLCRISLSAPLLSLRPRKDLVETLLHEMIHAYLFVTDNYRDREDHGPQFHKHMSRINKEAGTNITVYHSFFDEVAYYQKHIWRCNGPCQKKRPYFGFIQRAVNRAPGPHDTWWHKHKVECNGEFIKISGPEEKPKKKKKVKIKTPPVKTKDIREFFTPKNANSQSNIKTLADLKVNQTTSGVKGNSRPSVAPDLKTHQKDLTNKNLANKEQGDSKKDIDSEKVREAVRNVWANRFSGGNPRKRRKLQCTQCGKDFIEEEMENHVKGCARATSEGQQEENASSELSSTNQDESEVKQCPVCNERIAQSKMNEHLEGCLSCSFVNEQDDGDDIQCESVPCPCCFQWFLEEEMNSHIDECLTLNALKEEMLS